MCFATRWCICSSCPHSNASYVPSAPPLKSHNIAHLMRKTMPPPRTHNSRHLIRHPLRSRAPHPEPFQNNLNLPPRSLQHRTDIPLPNARRPSDQGRLVCCPGAKVIGFAADCEDLLGCVGEDASDVGPCLCRDVFCAAGAFFMWLEGTKGSEEVL